MNSLIVALPIIFFLATLWLIGLGFIAVAFGLLSFAATGWIYLLVASWFGVMCLILGRYLIKTK